MLGDESTDREENTRVSHRDSRSSNDYPNVIPSKSYSEWSILRPFRVHHNGKLQLWRHHRQ